jgi:uncharacterized protein (TIGR03086 family)
MQSDEDPATLFRAVANGFSARVEGTTNWEVPAPVEGWTARDVVRHLIEWSRGFLQSRAGVRLPAGPNVDDDPVAAWQSHSDAVQALLDDPATGSRVIHDRHEGDIPLAEAISTYYTPDVFMHTWDLARATGQSEALDPVLAAELLARMELIEDALRSSGHYGPRVEVPRDASVVRRLMGFIGRPSP